MEPQVSSIKSLFDHVESYTKTTFELYRLKLIDKSIAVLSALISQLAVIIVMSLFIIVLTIGVALWLGELLGKSYYGFFVVAGFYLVAGIVLKNYLHKWLRKPISNAILKEVLQ